MRDEFSKGQVRLQVNITSCRYYYTYIVYVVYGYLYIVNNCIGFYKLKYTYLCDSDQTTVAFNRVCLTRLTLLTMCVIVCRNTDIMHTYIGICKLEPTQESCVDSISGSFGGGALAPPWR